MKLNVSLIILLLTHAIAENDDAKDVGELEVKSAQKEDDSEIKESGDVSRKAEPESYTVPVEVVKDAVTESELVRTAVTEEQKEDSRIERSTASGIGELSSLKPEDDINTDTEHITNRRSNDATTKAASDDEVLVKTGESDNAEERAAKPESVAEKDDVLKKGEEVDQTDEPLVRNADDADAQEKSVKETESTLGDEVNVLARAAEVEDVTSTVAEDVKDLSVNLNTRRMLNPIIDTILDTKARLGEKDIGKQILKFAADDASEAKDGLNYFDSFRPPQSQTFLPPLMPLPNKQNFFLTPSLPAQTSRFGLPTQAPIRPFQMNFLHSSDHKPFNGLNSHPFQPSRTFPPFPVSTLRPLRPQVPFGNRPSFEELFKRPADDSKSHENFNFQNNGFNRRVQVPYGAVPYLRYTLN